MCGVHKSRFCFLGAFAKLRKATISFVMPVRLSVRPHRTTRLPLDGFSWNLIFEDITKIYLEKIKVSLKSDNNNGYCTCRPIYIFIISRSFLLRIRNISYKRCRENQNAYFVFSKVFFRKIVPFMR